MAQKNFSFDQKTLMDGPPFIVTGGEQKTLAEFQRGHRYVQALVVKVDYGARRAETVFEYKTPAENRPHSGFAHVFKHAERLPGREFLLTTNTEVLWYSLASSRITKLISIPCFNDVHHAVFRCGLLWVVSTGLDMVCKLTEDGNHVDCASVMEGSPWERFDKGTDYRKVISTKPHRSHPNHIFFLDDEPWVTRFEQKDAVSLVDHARRIDIGVGNPHDGLVLNGTVFFTTTNGHIVIVDARSRKRIDVINLNEKDPRDVPLGWCRGLFIDRNYVYVGFSRLRHTTFTKNLLWISDMFKGESRQQTLPTRIARYRRTDFHLEDEFVFEWEEPDCRLCAIFSILRGEPDDS